MSFSTFKRHILRLTQKVEDTVEEILPESFELVIDGRLAIRTHFVAIFASFTRNKNSSGCKTRLISFYPMEDELSMYASDNYYFMYFVLDGFSQSWSSVAGIIGDNCNTNESLARSASVSFIGCASHRFNPAFQLLLDKESLLDKVNMIMNKLKNLTLAGKIL